MIREPTIIGVLLPFAERRTGNQAVNTIQVILLDTERLEESGGLSSWLLDERLELDRVTTELCTEKIRIFPNIIQLVICVRDTTLIHKKIMLFKIVRSI